jgi:hypothetical protein
MYQYVINNIIPADDLHWDDIEKKYVSLSTEETQEIIASCLQQGIMDLDTIFKVVSWCGNIRVGQILWKNFMMGSLEISGFDREEPIFAPKKGE